MNDEVKNTATKMTGKKIDVKSFVTVSMTLAMIGLLFSDRQIPQELLLLFSTSYGAVITYFFTKPTKKERE